MPRRALCISFADLPPRPHRLSQEQLRHVFGGCGAKDELCVGNKECCSQTCKPYHSEIGQCE
jgi:hypothetical protein